MKHRRQQQRLMFLSTLFSDLPNLFIILLITVSVRLLCTNSYVTLGIPVVYVVFLYPNTTRKKIINQQRSISGKIDS